MVNTVQQGVPQLNSPMVGAGGAVTQPWYLFFLNLWVRTGGSQQDNVAGTYPGEIRSFGGNSLPTGWLPCNGAAVSRADYSNLFNVIGIAWGSGDGSTTFNVPGLVDKFLVGAGGLYALGSSGGSKTATLLPTNLASHSHGVTDPGHSHTFTGSSHSHTITDPHHTHTINDPGHSHTDQASASNATAGSSQGSTPGNTGTSTTGITNNSASTGITGTNATMAGGTNAVAVTNVSIGDTGSGTPFSIIPPYGAVNWMIKT